MKRLKVFAWSDGFRAYTLATTSRAKALDGWGFKRDLFKDGEAREITEGEDFDRALRRPGETLERGIGVDVGKAHRRKYATPRPGPTRADIARVDRIEADLAALDEERDRRLAAVERKRGALDDQASELSSDFGRRRAGLAERLALARARLNSRAASWPRRPSTRHAAKWLWSRCKGRQSGSSP